MAIENITATVPFEIIKSLGSIALFLQTIGVILIIWLCVMIINWLINRKRLKEVYKIKDDMKRIENKIDKLLKKNKNQ